MRSCVIIVENLPVPLDRRVWQEATALKEAGWKVSVICPATEKYPLDYEMIDGIAIYRHPLPVEPLTDRDSPAEYGAALFHEARLLLKGLRREGFDLHPGLQSARPHLPGGRAVQIVGKRFVFEITMMSRWFSPRSSAARAFCMRRCA